jgi:hypothetical protein
MNTSVVGAQAAKISNGVVTCAATTHLQVRGSVKDDPVSR